MRSYHAQTLPESQGLSIFLRRSLFCWKTCQDSGKLRHAGTNIEIIDTCSCTYADDEVVNLRDLPAANVVFWRKKLWPALELKEWRQFNIKLEFSSSGVLSANKRHVNFIVRLLKFWSKTSAARAFASFLCFERAHIILKLLCPVSLMLFPTSFYANPYCQLFAHIAGGIANYPCYIMLCAISGQKSSCEAEVRPSQPFAKRSRTVRNCKCTIR